MRRVCSATLLGSRSVTTTSRTGEFGNDSLNVRCRVVDEPGSLRPNTLATIRYDEFEHGPKTREDRSSAILPPEHHPRSFKAWNIGRSPRNRHAAILSPEDFQSDRRSDKVGLIPVSVRTPQVSPPGLVRVTF